MSEDDQRHWAAHHKIRRRIRRGSSSDPSVQNKRTIGLQSTWHGIKMPDCVGLIYQTPEAEGRGLVAPEMGVRLVASLQVFTELPPLPGRYLLDRQGLIRFLRPESFV